MQETYTKPNIKKKRVDFHLPTRFFMSPKTLLHAINQTGATLLENLIAAAVVGIGLAGFAYLAGNMSVVDDKTSQKSIAMTLAQDKIEEVKNLSRKIELPDSGSIASPVYSEGIWTETEGEDVDSEGAIGTSEAVYQRSWEIIPDPERDRLFDLSVNVSYTDRSSNVQSAQLATKISQNKNVFYTDTAAEAAEKEARRSATLKAAAEKARDSRTVFSSDLWETIRVRVYRGCRRAWRYIVRQVNNFL